MELTLGKPTREDAGALVWETRLDDMNYTTLKVWLNSEGQAQKREVPRAHGIRRSGFESSAYSSWTRSW